MPATLDQLQTDGAYFHIASTNFDTSNRHYTAACLATGLKRLGVPVYSNATHELFELALPGDERPGLNIFSVTERIYSPKLMQDVQSYTVANKFILSQADTSGSMNTPPDVPSLMIHESRFRRVINGCRLPWAFGLSDQVMTSTAAAAPFDRRRPMILRNFRPSRNQHIRNMLDWTLVPHLEKHFPIDRSISSDHCLKLCEYMGCLAYGGTWEEDLLTNAGVASDPGYQKYRQELEFHQPLVILRWDSWRWWESLAAGCLTFNLDLEKYGMLLPVMPESWKHYVPIDLSYPKSTVERLLDECSRWPEIAANGREWARTFYCPEAVAARLVDYVSPVDPAIGRCA